MHYVTYKAGGEITGWRILPKPMAHELFLEVTSEPVDYSKKCVINGALADLTEAELTEKAAALAYEKRPLYVPVDFIKRFTPDELRAIYTHAITSVDVQIWLSMLASSPNVDPMNATVQTGMAYMVYQGFITQQRHDEILNIIIEVQP